MAWHFSGVSNVIYGPLIVTVVAKDVFLFGWLYIDFVWLEGAFFLSAACDFLIFFQGPHSPKCVEIWDRCCKQADFFVQMGHLARTFGGFRDQRSGTFLCRAFYFFILRGSLAARGFSLRRAPGGAA